jgi:NF-kappa-B inhibitor alpha
MSTNNKKVEENSYTDSGFQSGFQESCEIMYEGETADKATADMSTEQGNSQTPDSDNFTDSGIITSGFISESQVVSELSFVPAYLSGSYRRPPQHPTIDKYFEQDEDGYTKLHVAIMQKLEPAINALTQLVPHSSYLNIRNYYGQTALHLAVIENQPETVKKLINAGADVNIRDNRCNTALHYAVINDSRRCAQVIVSAINSQKEKKLLTNLEQWNYEGETCFFTACKARNLFLMQLLASNGANVNAREGRSGYSALHKAVESKAAEVIKFLCEECQVLSIDTENYAGLTAFQLSLLTNQENVANYLMSRGATPYFTSEDSDMEDDSDASDYSGDEFEHNQIISKIAEIAVN